MQQPPPRSPLRWLLPTAGGGSRVGTAAVVLFLQCLILLDLCVNFSLGDRPSRIVESKHGKLQGRLVQVQTTEGYDVQVEVFKGIPFAAPPVGSLRFMPPVTVSPWRNVKSADKFRKVCPQQFPVSLSKNKSETLSKMSEGRMKDILRVKELLKEQGEDCLYLNVYAPFRQGKNNWKVHGLNKEQEFHAR